MPLDKDTISELKTNISLARKRALAFGLCLGKKPDGTILICHKTKKPEVLGRQAKKEGETPKFTFGTMTCEGSKIILKCLGDPPAGLAKRVRLMFLEAKLKVKVVVLDPSGNTKDPDGEDEEETETAPKEATAKTLDTPMEDTKPKDTDPSQHEIKWGETGPRIEAAIARVGTLGAVDLDDVNTVWDKAKAHAVKGAFEEAIKLVPLVAAKIKEAAQKAASGKSAPDEAKPDLMPKADDAAADANEADKLRWQEIESKIRPHIEEALANGAANAKKMSAVWSMAIGKATATPPDFAAAHKAARLIVNLLRQAKAEQDIAGPAKSAGRGNGTPKPTPDDTKPVMAGRGKPANLDGTIADKIKRVKDALPTINTLVTAYKGTIPGSGDAVPGDWTTEINRIKTALGPLMAPGATPDEKDVDQLLKDMHPLNKKIRDLTADKIIWKKAHDLILLEMVAVNNHPQAGKVPEVKPTIDGLKTDIAAAVALADSHDFKGATKAIPDLVKRAEAAEILADDYSHFAAILTQRQNTVNRNLGTVTGIKEIDEPLRKIELLLTTAQADAVAGKFEDGVKKLDEIPELFAGLAKIADREGKYRAFVIDIDGRLVTIDAKPVEVTKPLAKEIASLKKLYANGKYSKTKDYVESMKRLDGLKGFNSAPLDYIETELRAVTVYNAALAAFDPQHTMFKAHKGRPGVEAFFQGMDTDLTKSKAEAATRKFSTATALLSRTKGDWGPQKQNADDYLAYIDKRKIVTAAIVQERNRAGGETAVEQADGLMAMATTQALKMDYIGALASVIAAEKRSAEAKKAADATKALGDLKDGTALDDIQKDFDTAYKVFADMRAFVVTKDTGAVCAPLMQEADKPAKDAQDEKAKATPDFAIARTKLDAAITLLEAAFAKVLARAPYEVHLAEAKTMATTTLPPLSVDDCIKAQIEAVEKLITEAENLAKPNNFDFKGSEAKLTEAMRSAEKAKADAALWADIKIGKANANTALANIKVTPAIETMMPIRIKRLQDLISDIDSKVSAIDFPGAKTKAAEATGLLGPSNSNIATCGQIIIDKKRYVDDKVNGITNGPGKEAAKGEVAKLNGFMVIFEKHMTAENFDAAALTLTDDARWRVVAAENLITEGAAFETAMTAADVSIKSVADIRNIGVESKLAEIEAKHAQAVKDAAAAAHPRATKAMLTIPADCLPLIATAQAYKLFEDARTLAKDKLATANGHVHRAAIETMLKRLAEKYSNAARIAAQGDAAAGQKMMAEILSAATDAIRNADNAAIIEWFSDAIADSSSADGPTPEHILAANQMYKHLTAKPEAQFAEPELKTAEAHLKIAQDKTKSGADRNAALRAAMDACIAAQDIMSNHKLLQQAVDTAKGRVADLRSHTQATYITVDITDIEAAMNKVITDVATSHNYPGATADLEVAMTRFYATKALADAQQAYLNERAKPECEPRLVELEKHDHRYAIKAEIDQIRKKLATAADNATDRKHEAAMTLLTDIRSLGLRAIVLADMRDDKPPKLTDVKALLATPDGEAQLDAMFAKLEPDAQRKVIRVAFEARYGCDLDFINTATGNIIPDNARLGPNLKRFYEIMSELPDAHVVDNNSMREFDVHTSGGSYYAPDDKQVVMQETSDAVSSNRALGLEHENPDVDNNCRPSNDDPINNFSWNTLHEVGHAVDDKHDFMGKNQSGAAFGGWKVYNSDVTLIAGMIAGKYHYDAVYIGRYMANNPNPAVPALPTGADACSPEEWEQRRISVCAHVDNCREGLEPWDSASLTKKLDIGGVIYQESYANVWTSYNASARKQGLTGYQFRAPGEWFSELYAAYHSGKLKDKHPAVTWLKKL